MSGATNREVTLTLATQATGSEGVRNLADEFKRLAKEGGDAAPQFDRLSKELDGLAQQADLLAAFDDINAKVAQSATALDASTAAVKRHEAALAEKRQALVAAQETERASTDGMRQYQDALTQANIKVKQTRAELDGWKASVAASGAATAEQKAGIQAAAASLAQYKAEASNARASISALAPAHQQVADAAKVAAASVAQETKELQSASAAVAGAQAAQEKLAKTATEVGAAMKKAGLDAANLASEQARLAQAMSRIEGEGRRMQRAFVEAGSGATTAAQRIENAFGVVGVRSAESVKAEVLKINQALMALAREASVSGAEFNRAFAAGRARIAELESSIDGAGKATQRVHGFATSAGGAFTNMAATLASAFGAQKFLDANLAMDSSERALRVLTGSAGAAAKEMAYLKGVSERLGLDLKTAAEQYTGLVAASKDTALSTQQVRAAFEAVAGSMAVLGRSSMDTENALRAVQQIITKGTVSMEELRQQLGEKLPGALQGTARGLGITTEELVKLVSTGKLTADQVIPALTKSLEELYKTGVKVETFQSGLARATNKVTLAFAELGQAGVMNAVIGAFSVLGNIISAVAAGLVFFGKTIGNTLAFLADLRSGVHGTTQAFANFKDGMTEAVDEVNAKMEKLGQGAEGGTKALDGLSGKLVDVGNGVMVAADRIGQGAPSFVALTLHLLNAQDAADKHASALGKLSEARKKEGEGLVAAANALGNEADKRNAASAAATGNLAAVEEEISALRKSALARRVEIAAREEQVRLGAQTAESQKTNLTLLNQTVEKIDAEIAAKNAEAEAYRLHARALAVEGQTYQDNSGKLGDLKAAYSSAREQVAFFTDAQRAGLEVTQQLKTANENSAIAAKRYVDAVKDQAAGMVAIAAISGDERTQRQAAVDAANLQLRALQDMGQARSDEARALDLSVAKLETERKALEDNSKSIAEYEYQYRVSKAAVEQLVAAKAQGIDVSDKLASAELRLAQATALYRDSAKDQVAAVQAAATEKQASLALDQQAIRYQMEVLRTSAALAMAKGDEGAAARALNKIKELEIQLAGLLADAKRAEADAALAVVAAKREELRASGELTPVKEAELRAAELSAKAKGVEADIARETVTRMQELKQAHENSADGMRESTAAAGENASALDEIGKSARNAADGVDKLTAAEKALGIVKRPVSTSTVDHKQLAVSLGLRDEGDIAKFSDVYGNRLQESVTNVNQRRSLLGISTPQSYMLEYAGAVEEAKRNALNDVRIRDRGNTPGGSAAQNTAPAGRAPETGSTQYSVHTVEIKLPGGTSSAVQMATAKDSSNLVNLLGQLGTDMQRAA